MSTDTLPGIGGFEAPPQGAKFEMEAPSPLSPQGDIFLDERREGLGWGEYILLDSKKEVEICDDAILLRKTPAGFIKKVSLVDVSSIDVSTIPDEETHYRLVREAGRKLGFSPGRKSSAMSIEFSMDQEHLISGPSNVALEEISPTQKLSYLQAETLIEDDSGPYGELLREWVKVATALNNIRKASGDLTSFFDLEKGRVISGEGRIQEKDRKGVLPAVIIQEAMTLANNELARILGEAGVPLLYRNQKTGPLTRDQLLDAFERAVSGPEDEEALDEIHQGLSPVYLSAQPEGHFITGNKYSAKFSSGFNKFRDFVNAQQAAAFFRGEPLPYTLEQIAAIAEQINRRNRASHVHNINPNKFTHIVRTALEADKLGEHILVEAERRKSNGQLDGEGLSAVIDIHPDKKRADRMRQLLAS